MRITGNRNALILLLVCFTSSSAWSPIPRRSLSCARLPQSKRDTKCREGAMVARRDWRNHVLRGGARHSSVTDNNDGEIASPQVRQGMAAALFSTYFAVMGAKCALPSVLSLLISPKSGLTFPSGTYTPQQLMARVLAASTVAIALGKALSGPLIDKYGGIRSLQVTLTLLMVLLGAISSSQQFNAFAVSWIMVDFIFASCWAACVNAVHQSFPRQEWAKRIGQLAAAARTGNAAAFFTFAAVLQWVQDRYRQPWRLVFAVSAMMQVVPISLLTFFGRLVPKSKADNVVRGRGKQDGSEKQSSSLVVLRREARTPEFWLHMCSRSALMVFGSFLLFVPTLMSSVYGMSSPGGSNVGSIFAIGCLLSVTTGAQRYSNLSCRNKIMSVILMMGMATLSCGTQLAHMTGRLQLSSMTSSALMFLWGLSFAIPFYIPPSLYALARGGAESSATIVDVFDFGGFSLLAVFNGYVASINHGSRSAWIPTFFTLTACSAISLVTLALAVFFEEKETASNRTKQ